MAVATTKTGKVARIIADCTGRGWLIFNDKLADGTRSLKVWGWRKEDYEQAKGFLEGLGCKVKLVEFTKHFARANKTKTVTRLHVQE